jgi:hypothetical protein
MSSEESDLYARIQGELEARQAADRRAAADKDRAAQAAELRRQQVSALIGPLARVMREEVGPFVSILQEHNVRPNVRLAGTGAGDPTPPTTPAPRPRGLFGFGRQQEAAPEPVRTLSAWLLTSQMRVATTDTRGPYGYEGVKSQAYYRGLAVDPQRRVWSYEGVGPSQEKGGDIRPDIKPSDWDAIPVFPNRNASPISYRGDDRILGARINGMTDVKGHLQATYSGDTDIVNALDPSRRSPISVPASGDPGALRQQPLFLLWQDHLKDLALHLIKV